MVSFLKSSHGLALQRRSGRDDTMCISSSRSERRVFAKHKRNCSVHNVAAFLAMILVLTNGVKRLSKKQVEELLHKVAFHATCPDTYGTSIKTNECEDLDSILGNWKNPSGAKAKFTENESPDSDFIRGEFSLRSRQRIISDKEVEITTVEDKLGNTHTVMFFEQSEAWWIIIPFADTEDGGKVKLAWYSNKTSNVSNHSFFQQPRRPNTFYYVRDSQAPEVVPPQELNGRATEFVPVSVEDEQKSSPNFVAQKLSAAESNASERGSNSGSEGNNSCSRSNTPESISHSSQRRERKRVVKAPAWAHIDCQGHKHPDDMYFLDQKSKRLVKKSEKSRFCKPAPITYGTLSKCWNCDMTKKNVTKGGKCYEVLDFDPSELKESYAVQKA